MYALYKFICSAEQKSYIGITRFTFGRESASDAIEDRFKEHAKEDTPLGRAIAKYGSGNFVYSKLDQCQERERALELEHYYIRIHNTLVPNGYNQKS